MLNHVNMDPSSEAICRQQEVSVIRECYSWQRRARLAGRLCLRCAMRAGCYNYNGAVVRIYTFSVSFCMAHAIVL